MNKLLSVVVVLVAIVAGLHFSRIFSLDMLRFLISAGTGTLHKTGQVGDGREEALLQFVKANAKQGDAESVMNTIDRFGWNEQSLMNVGDAKGAVLDQAMKNTSAKVVMELGAYCGYSAVRLGRLLPADGRMVSIEKFEHNAAIARQVLQVAGLQDKVKVIVGTIGDGGKTMELLKKQEGIQTVDLVFIDHWKDAYVPDAKSLEENGFFHKGTVLVADNIYTPGAPEYLSYMQSNPKYKNQLFDTPASYHNYLKDAVLVSEYLG